MGVSLQLGLVQLPMGSMSHVLDLPRTKQDYAKYLRYVAYMSGVNGLV